MVFASKERFMAKAYGMFLASVFLFLFSDLTAIKLAGHEWMVFPPLSP